MPLGDGRVTRLRQQGQGISSGVIDSSNSRRRIDDESNWLDASSEEEDTDSDEERRPVPGGHAYAARGRQNPLISYVRNDWQKQGSSEKHHNPYYASHKGYRPPSRGRSVSPNCFDEMCESGSLLECLEVVWSKCTLRVVGIWTIVILVLFLFNRYYMVAAQKFAHDGALRSAVHLKLAGADPRGLRGRARTWFGTQHSDDFHGVVHMGGIRDDHWQWAEGKRLVIVGDVHGCSESLKTLLKETKFENGKDHLIFTGDLVAKGPDTAGVLDIARSLNASSVRGNHDDKLLLLHRDLDSPLTAMHTGAETLMTGQEVHRKESKLASALSSDNIQYLRECPLILDIGEVPGLSPRTLVVHAGLVPGLDLIKQDPSAIMNMRSIDVRTHTPLRVHAPITQQAIKSEMGDKYKELPPPWNGKKSKVRVFDLDEKFVLPWTRLWEEWQATVPKTERSLVIYGHDSAVGLVDGTWAVGLDSGCVKGGKLSALILEMKKGTVTRQIKSIECADQTAKKAASRQV